MVPVCALTALALLVPAAVSAAPDEGHIYVHNPEEDPLAMKDIVVNPDAVYGYSPDPESRRLGEYASYDWSDKALVESSREDRIAYHNDIEEMADKVSGLVEEGRSVEEIAVEISTLRNEIRMRANEGDPERLAKVRASNLKEYGNENGPTPEFLYDKYGSWTAVLLKAFASNRGMDACLGLYDDYYEMNDLIDELVFNIGAAESYIVRPGDSLSGIAGRLLGDPGRWAAIYEVNEDSIENPDVIFTGQEITIPLF